VLWSKWQWYTPNEKPDMLKKYVQTCHNLSLGLATMARVYKGAGQEWSTEVTFHAPERLRVWKNVIIELSHSQVNFHFGSWSPEFFKNDFRGQNPLDWRVPYINEKFLECKCLKWVRMTHLDIWNISYGQKKGHEWNC
jgi:hypothetical protein